LPLNLALPRDRARVFETAAPVAALAFDRAGTALGIALGDGRLARFAPAEGAELATLARHDGAALSVAPDVNATGFLSGGDDGRLIASAPGAEAVEVVAPQKHWIEHIASHAESKLRVASAGRQAWLFDAGGRKLGETAQAPSTLTGVAINPKGKRLAAAHYGGVSLWWTAKPEDKAKLLPWKGSHISLTWSPNGDYIVTGTQEREMHGWRLADGIDFRMSGYPAKPKVFAWSAGGKMLATSGSGRAVIWDFTGKGPMGKGGREVLGRGEFLCVGLAFHPRTPVLAAAFEDGSLQLAHLETGDELNLVMPGGAEPTALAFSPDGGVLVMGTEAGELLAIDLGAS